MNRTRENSAIRCGSSFAARNSLRRGYLAAAAVLCAVLIPAQTLSGQSLLSSAPPSLAVEPPATDRRNAGADETARPPQFLALLDMADRGEGTRAYPHLEALVERQRGAGYLGGQYPRGLHRRLLIALLKAGEGIASPANRERAARMFVDRYPDDPYFPQAFFDLIQALYRQDKPLEESFFFDQEALESLPAFMQTRYLTMQAEAAESQGRFARAAHFRLLDLLGPYALPETTRDDVLHLLGRIPDEEGLTGFIERHSDVPWLREEWPLLRARALINSGRLPEAYVALETIEQGGIARTASQIRILREARAEIEADVATRAHRIGILLPLGSSNTALRKLARDTLDGLRMAVQFLARQPTALEAMRDSAEQDWEPTQENEQVRPRRISYELAIKDTANSPEQAARMVEELVRKDHVIAVIGPIARSESAAAMAAAEGLGVPILALSITAAIPPGSKFAFRHNKSREDEVRDLVAYATDYLAARRFAILYPGNKYGRTMMNLFWDEVDRRGGQITAAAPFLPWSYADATEMAVGLKGIFENLAGVDRFVAPEDRELMEALDDDQPHPVVMFDALFIPISAGSSQDIRLIAPYPATVDAENEHLLGSRYWNSEEVLIAGGGKIRGAVFVDLYHRGSPSPANVAFRRRHRHLFRHRQDYQAPSFYTALGHDSLAMLTHLLEDPAHRTRRSLARALVRMKPFHGLTGLTSFLEGGRAVKESIVLRIAGDQVVPAITESGR
ncbi:MAG: penicillin-binding protein activator [SAR324 cluster bacterium]|nr:penicillin-binding protein activator [SAR324 cluster bacterium]